MATYIIDAGGAWRRYHPMAVPRRWRMLGTVASDHSIGALARSPAGLYAQVNIGSVQVNIGSVQVLDQRAVAVALTRVRLPRAIRAGSNRL